MKQDKPINVANEIAHTLKSCGVEQFFMLTGGDQPLWIALRDAGIKMIVARSEPGAVYMADGYARAGNRVAVTYGQAGPGAANVAAALADSLWAQSPVMALTGATATNAVYANEYQALDQFAMFAPVTKWNGRAEDAGQVARLVRHAVQTAVTGTPGPTHLDVPKDFFGRPAARSNDTRATALPKTRLTPPVDVADIGDAIASLTRAERPVILVGEGARLGQAGDAIAALSTRAGIPIMATMGGKPAVLSNHPNFCGIVGRYSSVTANRLLGEVDCVLAIGSRLGGLATNGYKLPSMKAHVIQVDSDPAAFANPYFPAQCVQADAAAFVDALAGDVPAATKPSSWLAQCRREVAEWNARFEERVASDRASPVLTPFTVLASLSRYASDVTVVADTGYMAAWTGVLFPIERYDRFFRAVGSLGWALPASLGVQLARPEKVVCITGDGGVGYHLADIETAVRYKIPVVVLVLNNDGLAFEYHEQKYRWNGNVVAEANDFGKADYAAVARALGADGHRVTTREELDVALAAAMKSDRPCVLDIAIDREAFPPVTNFEAVLERKL
ncbi:MAG: thiamine pyrophosphate-binding protein [Pseudolabrys sp.]|nr:thiamine pyrophosphate-binding protein [Pseudolabrys sp.]MDP2297120.1 thiamine pyrophosphate-binding protein [Pseudolabrys sp.]